MSTNDVAASVFAGQPVKNGYVVAGALQTGGFAELAPVCSGVNVPSAGELQAMWSARLLASGATYVTTR